MIPAGLCNASTAAGVFNINSHLYLHTSAIIFLIQVLFALHKMFFINFTAQKQERSEKSDPFRPYLRVVAFSDQ